MNKFFYFLFIFSYALQVTGQTCKDVCLDLVKTTSKIDVYVENKTYHTMSVFIDAELINMEACSELPVKIVLQPKQKTRIIRFEATKAKFDYNLMMYYVEGNRDFFSYNKDYAYRFPYKKDESFPVLQSCFTQFTHRLRESNAIDFKMPEGTPIYAARDGRVARLKVDSKIGGNSEKYIEHSNFIRIEHDDFTIADYGHIRYDGATVQLNEKVKRGQLIGYSGNTGYSTEPHLHFAILIPNPNYDLQTIAITWIDKNGNLIKCPQEGEAYIAGE